MIIDGVNPTTKDLIECTFELLKINLERFKLEWMEHVKALRKAAEKDRSKDRASKHAGDKENEKKRPKDRPSKHAGDSKDRPSKHAGDSKDRASRQAGEKNTPERPAVKARGVGRRKKE